MANTQLDVYLDLDGNPIRLGQAWFTQRNRSRVTTVFSYFADYLGRPRPITIDPALELVSGNQYVDGLPGAFQDCAPDRWGRNLVDKRHRMTAASDRRQPAVNEIDYLTGVSDRTRQGALRFTEPGGDSFLHPDSDIPKLIDLPRLLHASDEIAGGKTEFAAVKALLDAGSGSLGGARPKASVVDTDGRLLIAKFPHRDDDWDVMAWECVALDLAERARIDSPRHQLTPMSDGRNVLLLDRFDRIGGEQRVPYISAMTALSATDGDWHDYVELAERVTDFSADTNADLSELFRRVAFNVAIHNTDDHLRNHGFLAMPGGWRLAPVFDVNPNPDHIAERVTGISGATHPDFEEEGLAQLAVECRLTNERAESIRVEVLAAVAAWQDVAALRGIAAREISRFAPVFERHHP